VKELVTKPDDSHRQKKVRWWTDDEHMLARAGVWWKGAEGLIGRNAQHRKPIEDFSLLSISLEQLYRLLYLSTAISARAHNTVNIVGMRGETVSQSDHLVLYATNPQSADPLTPFESYVFKQTLDSTVLLLSRTPTTLLDFLLAVLAIMTEEIDIKDGSGRVVRRVQRGFVNIVVSAAFSFTDYVPKKIPSPGGRAAAGEILDTSTLFYELIKVDPVLALRYMMSPMFSGYGIPNFKNIVHVVNAAITHLPQLEKPAYGMIQALQNKGRKDDDPEIITLERFMHLVNKLREGRPAMFGKDPDDATAQYMKGVRVSYLNFTKRNSLAWAPKGSTRPLLDNFSTRSIHDALVHAM
jgi:hypothetical protein